MPRRKPRCIVIAGPNGAGKTTFARRFLTEEAHILHFVNADLIAAGLSPLDPGAARVSAGRLFLAELERHATERENFAFESTLAGLSHARRLSEFKKLGYRIDIVFLKLPMVETAIRRVALRVKQGGHNIPRGDIERRFVRGWLNFGRFYRPLADSWIVLDASTSPPAKVEEG